MESVEIRKIEDKTTLPWDLLLSADPSRKMVESYINNSDIYTASIGEKVVGEYVLTKIDDDFIELKNIAVDEKHQGMGIGKLLVLDAIKKAQEQGFRIIEVGTGNPSFSQLALYQKCGFRIVGIEKDFFSKNYEQEIIENGIKCVDMVRLVIEF